MIAQSKIRLFAKILDSYSIDRLQRGVFFH